MNSFKAFTLGIAAIIGTNIAVLSGATAQTIADLVGSWAVVSVDNVSPEGKRSPAFGPNPKGVVMMDADGRYVELILRSDIPKIAAGNRTQGTPEENAAVAQGVLAFYGPYSIAGKVVNLHVDGSSFQNWTGGDQKRTVTAYTKDEITWTNATGSSGGLVELIARRLNSTVTIRRSP
jgi:hypothetical protein